ncbi:putative proline-rich protein [Mycena sanguinolenta]|uniref:Putative proline-rich protein n=1 Tax=Mycena sanguinolenta TaxID=230812 RepID=A0A8H6XR70_9AGAR|nr:putative proline-rich protein [Mycena sanguinolenta]
MRLSLLPVESGAHALLVYKPSIQIVEEETNPMRVVKFHDAFRVTVTRLSPLANTLSIEAKAYSYLSPPRPKSEDAPSLSLHISKVNEMWTLIAGFDGQDPEALPADKTKLLKPNTDYVLGRKDVALSIVWKKISRAHGTFSVGKFTGKDVADPTTRPSLNYTNTAANKVAGVQRGDELHPINSEETFELLDGDVMTVASHVNITVRWHPVCCYQQPAPGKSKALLTSCASLGIHLVHLPGPDITHHITHSISATTLEVISLVSATAFVTSEWLDEVIRLGGLPHKSDPVSLEDNFRLPPIAKFRPEFDDALPTEQKTHKIWEPNEERMNMLSPYRFICVGEAKHQIDSEYRELLMRANAKIEVFDVTGGAEKWRKALTRAKAKSGQNLIPIANNEACEAAVGKDNWKELVETTRVFGLRFFRHEDIIQAVIKTDVSVFSHPDAADAAPPSSPLPQVIPNTIPDEGSLVLESEAPEEPEPVPPPRKLTRRVSSRQASQEPKPDEEAPAPRRHLTRRAQPTGLPIITGLDDPSILLNNLPDLSSVAQSAPVPAPVDTTGSKPRNSRLKRRVGTSAPVDTLISNAIMSGIEPETGEEPPLKKFKALFDASDPRRSGAESFMHGSGAFDDDDPMSIASGSQTQQTQDGGKKSTRSAIAPLRAVAEEEEEESQMPVDAAPADAGKKRKERSFDEDDVEMAGVEDALNGSNSTSGTGPAAKKRAVPGNAVEHAAATQPAAVAKAATTSASKVSATTKSTGKKDAAGAATGKPDTDDAFLKAIASTKRGKKNEDDFDRDFNRLKISKTNLRAEEVDHRPEWELLETFGDETNLRGNFMVIQDIEVFKIDNHSEKRAVGNDPRWEGKPDFKKFKKIMNTVARKKKIELIVSEDNDAGGLGPSYWKGGNSPAHSEDEFGPAQKRQTQPAKKAAPAPKSKPTSQAIIIDDSEDEVAPKATSKRGKPPSKAEPPKKRATRGASKAPAAPTPLFLDDPDSDVKIEEEPTGMDEDDFDAGQTLPSSAEAAPTKRSTRPTAKKKNVIVDDDSDDGAVFTGFGKKKTRR